MTNQPNDQPTMTQGMSVDAAIDKNVLPITGSSLHCTNWQLYCNAAAAVGSYSTKTAAN